MRAPARGSVLALAALASSGCAVAPHAAVHAPVDGRYCTPPDPANEPEPMPAPLATVAFSDALRAHYTRRSLWMAHAAGVASLLDQMESRAGTPAVTALAARALDRLFAAHVQASSAVAELDCESERAQQLSNAMEHEETSTNVSLTASSIAVGAAGTIASSVLDLSTTSIPAQEAPQIAGSVASAGLGLGTLLVHAHRRFAHPRNMLTDIWRGPARSDVYPAVVWFYLTQREFSNAGLRSIRQNLVARWIHYDQLGREGSAERARLVALYFGAGGNYSTEQLATRGDLLDEAQSSVALVDQELDRLTREVYARLAALEPRPAAE